jgi:antitoxin component of MazEF toxin-antitoxin module
MIKKLGKIGNSSALLLDKSTMDHLGLQPGDHVQMTVSGNSLIVNAVGQGLAFTDNELDDLTRKSFTRFDKSYRKLAE